MTNACSNESHKYSVPVSLLIHDDNPNAIHDTAVGCYRHLVAPHIPTGLWIRQIVQQSEEYIIQILNQQEMIIGEECISCVILCGDGYDILVLQNDIPYPDDIESITKVGVSLCLTTRKQAYNSKENIQERYGIVDPTDDLYLHMRVAAKLGVFPGNFRIYLQTTNNFPAYQDNDVAKKTVLRIKRHASNSFKISQIDEKDTPEDLFSYRHDPWGADVSILQSANPDIKKIMTKQLIVAASKKVIGEKGLQSNRINATTSNKRLSASGVHPTAAMVAKKSKVISSTTTAVANKKIANRKKGKDSMVMDKSK